MMKASQKKRTAGTRARDCSAENPVAQRPSSLRPLCAAIIGMMPILSGAQITPDANAERRPSMNQTANGTPLVNIVDPNARGISHNKFQQFNVGPNGVVFNNSMKDGISAIGGQTMKNPGLSNEARAIIGEVTGNDRSSLNGAMEVFGRKADVIIANPNGISVNGVSTVNTNSLTLSTGRVLEQADGSVRLGVDRGNVSIDGTGLSTEGLTHFDIVSRTVQLNGEVNGSADVKVVAGATEFNPETRTHQAVAGAANQGLAIDGSQLGSMYGGRIELIATDSGAGVRHQGNIISEQDLRISAAGDLQIGAAQSNKGNIDLDGRNVTVTGSENSNGLGLYSQGGINIHGDETVGLQADVVAFGGDVNVAGRNIVVTESQEGGGAGLAGHGNVTLQAADNVDVRTGIVSEVGAIGISGRNVSLAGTEKSDGFALVGEGNISLNALEKMNVQGDVLSKTGAIGVSATDVNVSESAFGTGVGMASVGDVKIDATGTVNMQATVSSEAGSIDVTGRDITIGSSEKGQGIGLYSKDDISLTAADSIDVSTGVITTDGAISMAADDITIGESAYSLGYGLQGQGDISLDANGDVAVNADINSLQGGIDISGKNIAITESEGSYGDGYGLRGRDDIALTASESINVDTGVYSSNGGIDVSGRHVTLNGSKDSGVSMLAQGDISLDALEKMNIHSDVISQSGGVAVSGGDVAITESASSSGMGVTGMGDITIDSTGAVDIQAGVQSEDGNIDISGQSIAISGTDKSNNFSVFGGGDITLSATDDVTINTGVYSADGGIDISGRNIELAASDRTKGTVLVGQGDISINATEDVGVRADIVSNNGSLDITGRNISVTESADSLGTGLSAKGDITLQAADNVDLNTGVLGEGNIDISGRNINLAGSEKSNGVALAALGDISLKALENIGVHADVMSQSGVITIEASTLLQHAANLFALNGDADSSIPAIRIKAGDYTIEGELFAVNMLGDPIEGAEIRLVQGNYVVYGQDGEPIPGARAVSNAQVSASSGNMVITADNLNSTGGALITGDGTLEIDVAQLLNNSGLINSGGSIIANAATFENTGYIGSEGDIAIDADRLENAGGVISNAAITATTENLVNTGRVLANGDVNLQASDVLDNAGMLVSGGTLSIHDTNKLFNHDGAWIQGDSLDLRNMDVLSNTSGATIATSTGDINIAALNRLENSGATIYAAGNASIAVAKDLNNTDSGSIGADGSLDIDAATVKNDGGASLVATTDLGISADSIDNTGGGIISGDTVALNANTITNSGESAIQGVSGLSIEAQTLTNADSGQILGGGTIDIAAANVNNTGASLIEAAERLTIATERLRNAEKSFIQSGDALRVQGLADGSGSQAAATRIDNSGGSMIYGANSVDLIADTVSNVGDAVPEGTAASDVPMSYIYSDGKVSIDAKTVTAEGNSQIAATNEISIDADTVSNGSGAALATDGQMTIHADSLTNRGVIAANGLDVSTKTFDNKLAEILAYGNANIQTQSFLNQDGSIVAGGKLKLDTSNSLVFGDSGNGGALGSNDTLDVHSGGDITVQDKIENYGSISLKADGNVYNNGAMISLAGIYLKGDNIYNYADSLIWGMQEVSLDATSGSIYNKRNGNILSQGNMFLKATESIINEAGTIRSENDMALDAKRIENRSAYTGGDVIAGPYVEEYGYNKEWRSITSTTEFKLWIDLPTFTSDIALEKTAEISAGGNMFINQSKDFNNPNPSLLNEGGIIASGKNMYIRGDVTNQPKYTSINFYDYVTQPLPGDAVWLWTYWNDAVAIPNLYGLLDWFYGKAFVCDVSPTTCETRGNMTYIKGDDIEGKRDAGQPQKALKDMDGAQINLVMSTLFGPTWKAMTQGEMEARWADLKKDDNAKLKQMNQYFLPQEKGAISAGGSIVHEGGSFSNGIGGVQQENKSITVKIGDQEVDAVAPVYDVTVNIKKFEELEMGISTLPTLQDLISVKGMFNISPEWLKRDKTEGQSTQTNVDAPTGGADVPTDDRTGGRAIGLAQGDEVPRSAPKVVPMYETGMEFMDQSKFYGTDYFFDQIGYNSNVPAYVIGDNFFINELIRRQINDAVGTFFAVRDNVQGADLVKMLMDNAGNVAANSNLGLVVGQALTPDQIAALDKDIIWYVNESVNGETVLVPRVYLAKTTMTQIRDGEANGSAVVSAGDHVVIDADSMTNANGSIVAGGDVVIRSKEDLVNISAGMSGGISAGGSVSLDSINGSIKNNGAYISAGQDVFMKADNGAVDITASVGYDAAGNHKIHEFADGIYAGGNVQIKGKDVTLNSATIDAKKNVAIEATSGSIQSNEMHEMSADFSHSYEGGGLNFKIEEKVNSKADGIGSNIKAGEGLSMKAGEDIVLEGGAYAGQSGKMEAGNKLDIKTSTNYDYSYEHVSIQELSLGGHVSMAGHTASAGAGIISGGYAEAGLNDPTSRQTSQASNATDARRPGKANINDSIGAEFGLSKITETSTEQSLTHENAQLNFGSGGLEMSAGTVDFGGADIKTPGALSIAGDTIQTTKYEDTKDSTYSKTESFIGVKVEGHSAIADTLNKYTDLGINGGMDGNIDGGMTTLQVAGDVSNLVFNDLAGASVSFGMSTSTTNSNSKERSENVNNVEAGSISMTAKNDIDLAGVKMKADTVSLEAGNDISIETAKAWSESNSSTDSYKAGISEGASCSAIGGCGVGVSVDVSGSHDQSSESSMKHTTSTIDSNEFSMKTGGDATLAGTTVNTNTAKLDVGGDLNIETVQDTVDNDRSNENWSFSVGAAVTTNGVIMPTAGGSAGGGSEYRDERTSAAQAGIVAKENIEATVGGDLNLTGGQLVSKDGKGKLDVAGEINAKTVSDTIEQDGGYGGGGGGVGMTSVGSISGYGSTVEEVHKQTDRNATIAGFEMSEGTQINGDLNRDASKATEVIRDEVVAGNNISFTVGIGDLADATTKKKGKYDMDATGPDGGTYRPLPDVDTPNWRPDTPDVRPSHHDTPDAPPPHHPTTPDHTPTPDHPVAPDHTPTPDHPVTPDHKPTPTPTPEPRPVTPETPIKPTHESQETASTREPITPAHNSTSEIVKPLSPEMAQPLPTPPTPPTPKKWAPVDTSSGLAKPVQPTPGGNGKSFDTIGVRDLPVLSPGSATAPSIMPKPNTGNSGKDATAIGERTLPTLSPGSATSLPVMPKPSAKFPTGKDTGAIDDGGMARRYSR
jgi:filamentous hemagglutinin